jgi:hypothetical protein
MTYSYIRIPTASDLQKMKRCIPFPSNAIISDKSSSKLASPTCLIGRPTGRIAPPRKYSTGKSYTIIHS